MGLLGSARHSNWTTVYQGIPIIPCGDLVISLEFVTFCSNLSFKCQEQDVRASANWNEGRPSRDDTDDI